MKKLTLLAGACALFFVVACGDDSSTSSKDDTPSTAEIDIPKETPPADSGCTVKEADGGFDIICNGDSIDTIHDEETEQGTCHVKDTVDVSGNDGVKITCGDSTRVVWSAKNDDDENSASSKEKSSSSGKEKDSSSEMDKSSSSDKKESTEKSSSSVESDDPSSSDKADDSSTSKDEEISSSSKDVKSSSSSEKAKDASSSDKAEATSSANAKSSSSEKQTKVSSSSSEEIHPSSATYAPTADTLVCNSKKFTTDTAFCFESRLTGTKSIYKLCGGLQYDPDVATCEGETIKVECGSTAYDTLKNVCLNELLYPLTATEKGIEGVYIGANDTTFDSDKNIISIKPIYFAKGNLLLVKKDEGVYEGVVPPSPGIISKGARVKYHNEQYYDIEADTLDLFLYGDTSGYFYLTSMSSPNNIEGNDAYDIARAKLGGKWRLPRVKEMKSLSGKMAVETIIDHHTLCTNITNPIHKTEIALPSSGVYTDTAYVNFGLDYSYYMTSQATYIFSTTSFTPSTSYYYSRVRFGFAVRPVFSGE